MQPVIELKNVSVVYQPGQTSEVWGAKDINLKILPKEYIVFFGPSGSGKSTLLNLIAGLEQPASGNVIVNGQDLGGFHEDELVEFHRYTIGIIFQAFYLISSLNIKDNLLLPQIFQEAPVRVRLEKLDALAKRFGIDEVLEKKPSELSGGQQQRVAIARALINNPNIILADEPVGNLDSKNAEITMNLLATLNQEDKKTIILVTHDPRYLVYADRTFYIKDGKIEKEVVNPNKKSLGEGQKASEYERLAQEFPYLSDSRLYSKLIVNEVLSDYSFSDMFKVEEWVDQLITGKIKLSELKQKLDESQEKGGLSLYHQTAVKIANRIEQFTDEINKLNKDGTDERAIRTDILALRDNLVSAYKLKLTQRQLIQLNELLVTRAEQKIGTDEMIKVLDSRVQDGGLGLNKRTVKKIVREIDTVLPKQ